MIKLRIFVLSFILVTLLMCSCERRRLPSDQYNSKAIIELYKLYQVIESDKFVAAEQLLESEDFQDINDIGRKILCAYQNLSCDFPEEKKEDIPHLFGEYIIKLVKHDTTSLRRINKKLGPYIEENIPNNNLDFRYSLLFFDHWELDLYKIQTQLDGVDRGQVLHFALDKCLEGKYFFLKGKENITSAYYKLIFHLVSKYNLDKHFPFLIAEVLIQANRFFIATYTNEENYSNNFDHFQKEKSFPAGLKRLKIQNDLLYLLSKKQEMDSNEIISFYKRKILKNINGQNSQELSQYYFDYGFILEGKNDSLAFEYYKRSIEVGEGDMCSSTNVAAINNLIYFYLLEDKIKEAQKVFQAIEACIPASVILKYTLLSAEESIMAYLCKENLAFNPCSEAVALKYIQDSIFESILTMKDEYHLSDYYAFAASVKFEYYQILEQYDTIYWKNVSLNELQNTKYRIFNLLSSSSAQNNESINRKEYKINNLINTNALKLDAYKDFQGPTDLYLEQVKLNIDKLKLEEQVGTAKNLDVEIESKISEIQMMFESTQSQSIELFQYEDALRVFVMNPDTFYHESLQLDDSLDYAVTTLKQHQRYPISDKLSLKPARKYLYKVLLADHLNISYENLIIIPDGILNGVSFETLIDDEEKAVIEKYKTSYAFGINMASEWTYSVKELKKAAFLSFTDGETLKDRSIREYTELPGAQKEVIKCAAILSSTKTKVYAGKDCSEKNISKALLSDIAHIATHAVSDPQNSIGNYFITRIKNGTEKTYGYEFNNKESKCSLAVLSACETGIGKFEVGEGVFSLSRNLQLAGVPSVIKTLWKVDDENSHYLMEYFYKYLSEGNYFGEALRNAKLDYMKYHNTDPYFWSGYVLEGNPYLGFKF